MHVDSLGWLMTRLRTLEPPETLRAPQNSWRMGRGDERVEGGLTRSKGNNDSDNNKTCFFENKAIGRTFVVRE